MLNDKNLKNKCPQIFSDTTFFLHGKKKKKMHIDCTESFV